MRYLYRQDLDSAFAKGCAHNECTCKGAPEFIHAGCHIGGGLDVRYSDGVLELLCSICDGHVAAIKVADKPVKLVASSHEGGRNGSNILDIREGSKKDKKSKKGGKSSREKG